MNKFAHIELGEKELAERTLDYILNNQNSCLGSSLYIRILDPRINYGDFSGHIEFLKERFAVTKPYCRISCICKACDIFKFRFTVNTPN